MIFRFLSSVPIFGDIFRILNSYAYHGDSRAEYSFANLLKWIMAFGVEVSLAVGAALFCMPKLTNQWLPCDFYLQYSVAIEPGILATGILPNLLGFGIGVYALIFGLNKLLLRELQDIYVKNAQIKEKSSGSVLVLNAEMAVPLLILVIAIAFGVVQQILTESCVIKFLTWSFFWLSIIFVIELISTLYGLGENVILKNISTDDMH